MKFHPDNPRFIDKHARSKLKKLIQKRGYIGGIIWNERTGHIVAGHQRIDILDELNGGQDWGLEIDIINADPKTEKELLVALNNEGMMGQYDVDKLGELLPELNLDLVGFDQLDIEMLFPDRDDLAKLFTDSNENPAVLDAAEEIQRIKAERKRFKEQEQAEGDAGFYRTLVFASQEEAECFAEFAGADPESAFWDGRAVVNGIGGNWDELWIGWCQRNKPEG